MTPHPAHPVCGMLAAAALLCGCSEPAYRSDPASTAAHTVRAEALAGIAEPGPHEVAVIINGNAYRGIHAGLFIGATLYDPSGTYVGNRSGDRAWRRPTLVDYLDYQLADGPDVRLYRFPLNADDFTVIRARIKQAGWTMPTYCANSVRDALAGVGPFRGLAADGWISPKRLAAELDRLASPVPEQTVVHATERNDTQHPEHITSGPRPIN